MRAREKGRDELAFPAPVGILFIHGWEAVPSGAGKPPQADVTGFLGEGRSSPHYDQETRRRAASARNAIKQVVRAGKTGREAESHPSFRGFGVWGEHSR